jgi:hypothetical protein
MGCTCAARHPSQPVHVIGRLSPKGNPIVIRPVVGIDKEPKKGLARPLAGRGIAKPFFIASRFGKSHGRAKLVIKPFGGSVLVDPEIDMVKTL